jgi:DNA polymerase-3 subunit epsilon
MDFVALDFETANGDLSSICQVGLVAFRDGGIAETYSSLVNPDDQFDPVNISIHGIDEQRVRDAPIFQDVYPQMALRMSGAVVVCHTLFDRSAMRQACARHGLADVSCRWLDTTRVVRQAWPQYERGGYNLANLTRDFGIAFSHHDAAEDARATGLILVKALQHTGVSLEDWVVRCSPPPTSRFDDPTKLQRPKRRWPQERIIREGSPDGRLSGEVAVFTGALSMPRHEAADLAAGAGCKVNESVTKATTLLIVGNQDEALLAPGQSKSGKRLKAEALIAKGQPIRILREREFRQLVNA